jgi:hypothetical protein
MRCPSKLGQLHTCEKVIRSATEERTVTEAASGSWLIQPSLLY